MNTIFAILLATLPQSHAQSAIRMAASNGAHQIQKALLEYFEDCGVYPTTEQGLRALQENLGDCAHWGSDPYLKTIQKDPWGHEWHYVQSDSGYTLISYGADGREGGSGEDMDLVIFQK